jgi:hypothetical protein
MAYLIIRVEHVDDMCKKEKDRQPPVLEISKRSRLGDMPYDLVNALLNKKGYELGPIVGQLTPRDEWPFTAVCYTSFRKDGVGRSGSTLQRWPVRKLNAED